MASEQKIANQIMFAVVAIFCAAVAYNVYKDYKAKKNSEVLS